MVEITTTTTDSKIPTQLRGMRFNRVRFQDKRAFEKGWQKKPYTFEQIQNYFPKENYGVLCGKELRVLDDDSSNNELVNLFLKKFGETFRVRDHLYFNFDNDNDKKIIFYKEGKHLGELQGEGTYVVGAGSTHPSGELYKQKNDLDIITISYDNFMEVFKEYKIKGGEPIKQWIPKKISNDFGESVINEVSMETILTEIGVDTELNPTNCFAHSSKGGKCFSWNSETAHCFNCDGSWNKFSLIKDAKKMSSKETFDWFAEKAGMTEELKQNRISFMKGCEEKIGGFKLEDFLIIKIDSKTGKEISRKVDIDKVAEHVENKFNIRTIFGIREETIEIYREGVWEVKGRGIIKAEVENLLGNYSKNNVVSEVLEKIKRQTGVSREDVDNIPDYKRCVLNGVLDLENVDDIKFLSHSKKYNFRNKYPMDYNQKATCPEIKKFINETFYSDDIPKIQEWLGFHLIRRYEFKKAVIIHGARNTGKSVFLNLLNIFLNYNVSGLALQEIAKGKPFDLLVLKDKDANIHDDMSSQDMKSIGGFKMAVGDGFISAEQKFGDKIRFRNTAKQTNACNKLPNPGEDIDDEAYYERILLISADNTIPKEGQKKNLIDRLTTPEELSGLLNLAIEGYKRLVSQNGFSNEKSPEETKYLMIKNGNSLAEFSAEVLIESTGEKMTKDDLYFIYCKWCFNHNPKLSPDSKEKIGRSLTKFSPFISAQSSGKNRYWLNVRANDTYDTFLKKEMVKTEKRRDNRPNADTYDTFLKKEMLKTEKRRDNRPNADTYDTFQKNISKIQGGVNDDVKNNTHVFSKSVISVSENPLLTKKIPVSKSKKVSEVSLEEIKHCPKCNAPVVNNKCIGCTADGTK